MHYCLAKHSDRCEKKSVTLTDIIVAFSLAELLPKSKWSETLELFGELLRGMRSKRMAALPAHLVVRLGLAGFIVLALHHVEHISLGIHQRHLTLRVMGANDVQIVIELHLHGVVVPKKPAGEADDSYASGRRLITMVIVSEQ